MLGLRRFQYSATNIAAIMGGASDPDPGQHTAQMISQWLFSEGSGTTVADAFGASNINLSTPTSPNYTWSSRGISLAAGLVQTPSITGVRTVAILYKTGRAESGGYLLSGGTDSGGGRMQTQASTAYTHWHAGGWGPHPLITRTSNGTSAVECNRGGYCVAFIEFDSAKNTPFGFGGRHSTTTSRCTTYEILAAACWSDQLSDSERTTVYNYFGWIARQRGVYLRAQDCPTQRKAVIIWGESNASGRGLISDLTAGEQSQTFTKTWILSSKASVADGTGDMTAPAQFVLGTNQTQETPATQFGPELAIAQAVELGSQGVNIIKHAHSSARISEADANGAGDPSATTTYNIDTLFSSGYFGGLMRSIYDSDQASRNAGVGLTVVGVHAQLGLNDADNVNYCGGSAATYQGYWQAIHDKIESVTGLSGLKWHVARPHNNDSGADPTARDYVRTGIADFVTGLGANGELMDTDSLALLVDNLHYTAASQKTIGAAAYAFLLT